MFSLALKSPEPIAGHELPPYPMALSDSKRWHQDAMLLDVKAEGAYERLTGIYAEARRLKKRIDEGRKALGEPYRQEIARINDHARSVTDILDKVIELANTKTAEFVALQHNTQKQAEKDMREIASIWGCDEVHIPEQAPRLKGNGATGVVKVQKKFRIIDVTKVPARYLEVNESAVKQDLALGITSIPGLEIYEETTTQLRLR